MKRFVQILSSLKHIGILVTKVIIFIYPSPANLFINPKFSINWFTQGWRQYYTLAYTSKVPKSLWYYHIYKFIMSGIQIVLPSTQCPFLIGSASHVFATPFEHHFIKRVHNNISKEKRTTNAEEWTPVSQYHRTEKFILITFLTSIKRNPQPQMPIHVNDAY